METYEGAKYEFVEQIEDPEETASSSDGSNVTATDPDSSNDVPAVFRLIHQRPLLFWGSVWITLVVLSALSTLLLISPFLAKREAAPVAAEGQTNSAANEAAVVSGSDSSTDSIPWWALGAMAVGCATGSMLISQRWNRSQSVHKSSKRSKASSRPTVTVVPANLMVTPRSIQTSRYEAEPTSAEPIVTIVPADETTPLDWDEPSLADLMDMRRRRPLSSWF